MIQVVRLNNPKALLAPPMQELFRKAFDGNPLIAGIDDAPGEYVRVVTNPAVGLFVGVEKGEFKGLVLVELPGSPLAKMPNVLHFANFGTAKLRDALIQAALDFIVQAGYTRFVTINLTGRGDAVHNRLFKKVGKAKPLGSVLEYRIG